MQENEVYSGNLAYNVMDLPCAPWSAGARANSLTWEELNAPDEDWDSLSNKCRQVQILPDQYKFVRNCKS